MWLQSDVWWWCLTYASTAWKKSLLPPRVEEAHEGNEHDMHHSENNVSDESERAAEKHLKGFVKGRDCAAGDEEADCDCEGAAHEGCEGAGAGGGGVIVEEAVFLSHISAFHPLFSLSLFLSVGFGGWGKERGGVS